MNLPRRLEAWLPIAHVIDSFVNVVCRQLNTIEFTELNTAVQEAF